MMPLISIIVPVYNTKEYLPKCIDSILEQNSTIFELILIEEMLSCIENLCFSNIPSKSDRYKYYCHRFFLGKCLREIKRIMLYKNECQNWRNKINRVKNTAGFPADRLEKIQAAFSDFKKEALQRKKAVKTGTASPKEFTDWLYQQSNVIVELTEY